jgi:hypothetical protein
MPDRSYQSSEGNGSADKPGFLSSRRDDVGLDAATERRKGYLPMNGDTYIANGYFAETVVADGPQEARFRFAMKHGVRPDLVEVSQPIRMRQFEYWCSVGTAPDPYLSTEVVS